MRLSKLAPSSIPLALACAVALFTACSNQGEGERCDRANGEEGADSDCADGLICTPSEQLGTNSDICCPKEGAPTELACIPSTNTGTGGEGGTSSGGSGGTAGSGGDGGSTGGSGGDGGIAGGGGSGGNGGNGGSGGSTGGGGNGGGGGG